MTKKDRNFIIACAIGDGCINKRYINNKNYYRFLMKHSIKQKDYFLYKAKIIESILNKTRIKFHRVEHNCGRSNITCYSYEKGDSKNLKPVYNMLYSNNKKTYSLKLLNHLNPLGLAIWFMDDGSLYNFKHTRKNGSQYYSKCRITLSTYVSYEENEIIQKYFIKKWNIKWNIHKDKTDSGKLFYRLSAGTKEARKFFEIINPFVHKSMVYKTNIKVGQEVLISQRKTTKEQIVLC